MKLVRYIYPPDGKVRVEGKIFPVSNQKKTRSAVTTNRIEIFNIQGDLLSVIIGREKIKQLRLQKGFYLLREKDKTGRIISSRKLVF